MPTNRDKYIFSEDYESYAKNLDFVCDIPKSTISFIEVCILDSKQVCISRKAKMKGLYANSEGELFFEGYCYELAEDRIFELVMKEYEINGKNEDVDIWFFKLTGENRYYQKLECYRKNSTTIWNGNYEKIKYTDVYPEVVNNISAQKIIKREVVLSSISYDSRSNFYIQGYDVLNSEEVLSYMESTKINHGKRRLSFEKWCEKELGLDIYESFDEDA